MVQNFNFLPLWTRWKGRDVCQRGLCHHFIKTTDLNYFIFHSACFIFPLKKKTASLALAFREDIFKMYVHNDIWDVTCVVPKNEYNIYYFPLRVLNLIQASNSVWSISQFAKRVVNTTKILALQQTVYIRLLSENYIIKRGRHYRNSSKYCIFAAKKAVLSLLNQSLFIRELSTL